MTFNYLRRSPRRLRPVSPKREQGAVGGSWEFDFMGRHYSLPGRFVQDVESPSDDGLRWIATPQSNKVIRGLVERIAERHCQLKESKSCWDWSPVGHAHHVRHKKMGGAFTDDRIWIVIDGEKTQIRIWACYSCHDPHHNKLHWSKVSA